MRPSVLRAKLSTLFLGLVCTAACTAPTGGSIDAMASSTSSEPPISNFRSSKTVSSTCRVAGAPRPPPGGFEERIGTAQREMPPPVEAMMAVGANRPAVQTDIERVAPGYTLIEPLSRDSSFLIDNDHNVVAFFDYENGRYMTEILPNGHRLVSRLQYSDRFGTAGGYTGCMMAYSADGELLWEINLANDDYMIHHDFALLPNGNILLIVWESVSTEEAIAMGRDPEAVSEDGDFWYDGVIEVNPETMEIVWEWSAHHHLIQEFDSSKANYGVVADHPELLDINKYLVSSQTGQVSADWTHVNTVDYNEALDQIVLSSYYLSEMWVIDHSTTPAESAGHSGGRYGKGGDFLYRWGNPQNYNRGTEEDRRLYRQHDTQWIRDGLDGAGNFLIYSNGDGQARRFTTVDEIVPPMNEDGSYRLEAGEAYGPREPVWQYNPDPPERFFSWFISGVQRLPNGNTLINQGAGAKVREVTSDGEIVWEYRYTDDGVPPGMLFRVIKYPPDHPGIRRLLGNN